jgi:uncharacterized protein (TIGR00725 family)
MATPYIAVVGAGITDDTTFALAEAVGRGLAERGAVLLCGGSTGVMEAACKGAKSAGGTTVGILPGWHRSEANDYVDIAIPTGLGEMRNGLIVRAADVVVAVAGEFGTLSEVALALKTNTPVVALRSWELHKRGRRVEAFIEATTPEEAVAAAERLWRAPSGERL